VLKPGAVLNRVQQTGDDRDSIRLVGLQGGTWVATSAEGFGGNFEVSDHELARDYAVRDFERPESEREIMLQADREASTQANRDYGYAHVESVRARRRDAQIANLETPPVWPPVGSPEARFLENADDADA